MSTPHNVISFIVRFHLIEKADPSGEADLTLSVETLPLWHGMVRHIQSGEEYKFVHIDDAVAFINRYLPAAGSAGTGVGDDSQVNSAVQADQ